MVDISWLLPKNLKYQSHNTYNRISGEMESSIFETYMNTTIPRFCYNQPFLVYFVVFSEKPVDIDLMTWSRIFYVYIYSVKTYIQPEIVPYFLF